MTGGDGLRYRKDQLWRPFPLSDTESMEAKTEAMLEGVLSAEIALTVLDSLDLVVQVRKLRIPLIPKRN